MNIYEEEKEGIKLKPDESDWIVTRKTLSQCTKRELIQEKITKFTKECNLRCALTRSSDDPTLWRNADCDWRSRHYLTQEIKKQSHVSLLTLPYVSN